MRCSNLDAVRRSGAGIVGPRERRREGVRRDEVPRRKEIKVVMTYVCVF
jgi:hypothetical protein